ncbi:MAG: 2-dehydro-3-deoxygalactonokinase [Steroidobacteraceae bacterium]
MSLEPCICGDWGTTRLRLFLCRGERVLETLQGPGVGARPEPADQTLRSLIAGWQMKYGPLPLVLCGMAGSRNGWRESAYLPCPADLRGLGEAALRFEWDGAPVLIAPGLSCTSRLGSPEGMRGEETQMAGALALHPRLGTGRHLLCLPGTHTKWVCLEDAVVRDFLTALTGELFALLRDGSTLTRASRSSAEGETPPGASEDGEEGFEHGLEAAATLGTASLLHALFAVRSRQLLDRRSQLWALSYLSGLLIGSDARGAIPLFGAAAEVVLIGDSALTERYARALDRLGIAAPCLDGDECALAGLRSLWRR